MKIGVDCDNVLNNLTESVLEIYNSDHSDMLTTDDITKYFVEHFIKDEAKDNFHEYFVDKRVWKNIKVLDGAVKTLKKYHDLGHEIFIITATRPENIPKKARWIAKNFPFLDVNKTLILLNRKQLLSGNIDVLIDDCLDNLVYGDYERIVFDYPWNKEDILLSEHRCKNWNEIDKTLDKIIRLKKCD